jgi:hypothetical protein
MRGSADTRGIGRTRYCHKVWLQLEEKRVPYRVEKINMRWYEDDPSPHQLPTEPIDWAFALPRQLCK